MIEKKKWNNKINVIMKNGYEYFGYNVLPETTSTCDRLVFQNSKTSEYVIVNWIDVKEAVVYTKDES